MSVSKRQRAMIASWGYPTIAFICFLLLWQLVVVVTHMKRFVLPQPLEVIERGISALDLLSANTPRDRRRHRARLCRRRGHRGSARRAHGGVAGAGKRPLSASGRIARRAEGRACARARGLVWLWRLAQSHHGDADRVLSDRHQYRGRPPIHRSQLSASGALDGRAGLAHLRAAVTAERAAANLRRAQGGDGRWRSWAPSSARWWAPIRVSAICWSSPTAIWICRLCSPSWPGLWWSVSFWSGSSTSPNGSRSRGAGTRAAVTSCRRRAQRRGNNPSCHAPRRRGTRKRERRR